MSMVGIETRLQEVELEMQLQNAEQNWMGERVGQMWCVTLSKSTSSRCLHDEIPLFSLFLALKLVTKCKSQFLKPFCL